MVTGKLVVFVGSNVFVGSQKAGHNKLTMKFPSTIG